MNDIKRAVLNFFLKNPSKLIKRRDLAKILGIIEEEDYNFLKGVLWELENEKLLSRQGKRFSLLQEYPDKIKEKKTIKQKKYSPYSSLLEEFEIPLFFNKKVLDEESYISNEIAKEEYERRIDYTAELSFTIDPDDAKDFDDSISLKKIDDKSFELGIHISDISHYIKENSELDKEAFSRGTSIYLPGTAIPMLPERLTNEVFSLRPNEKKLTFSVLVNITNHGNILSYRIAKTITESKKRFTYKEAQKIIDFYKSRLSNSIQENEEMKITLDYGKESEKSMQTPSTDVKINPKTSADENVILKFGPTLFELYLISLHLMNQRFKNGSIDFETGEPEFIFDKEGTLIDIRKRERLDTNRMIEEFMLLANRIVSEEINKQGEKIIPFIYRVHDNPPEEKVDDLMKYLNHFGIRIKKKKLSRKKDLQKLLLMINNSPNKEILNDIIIRSMAKAIYSEDNIGHFGLGFDYYTHFTSPIRRYPDLIVHRILTEYLIEKREKRIRKNSLSKIAIQSSELERRAMTVERESSKIRQIEFLSKNEDRIYEAIITNIVSFGFFLELPEYLISGLVHIKNLRDDYYHFDENKYRLVGEHTGKIFNLGDRIQVRVYILDSEHRRIDFEIIN